MLYLPAMWYHDVAQTDGTISVNYWYDMDFGANYIHHAFLQDITDALHGEAGPSAGLIAGGGSCG